MKSITKLFVIILGVPFLFALGCEPVKIPEHRKDELVVLYKDADAKKKYENLLDSLFKVVAPKVAPELKISKKVCSECLGLGVLLTGVGIERAFLEILGPHGDAIPIKQNTTGGATDDGSVVINLNFLTSLPGQDALDSEPRGIHDFGKVQFSGNEIIVGVLDSGISSDYFPSEYLWRPSSDNDCYSKDNNGWSFVSDDADISDNTSSQHGTLVNAFILEQFIKVKVNRPKLLNVKVLDQNNSGSLFDLVCGVLYAKENGAKIINTSLGYYDNQRYEEETEGKEPILYWLHKAHLAPSGILWVTAAGNIAPNENFCRRINPRNLTENRFYPAIISETETKDPNTVITVTTINRNLNQVSPRQNHSPQHVDVGVVADMEDGEFYRFHLPFTSRSNQNEETIQNPTGSSMASAIAAGLLGATFNFDMPGQISITPKYMWKDELVRKEIFHELSSPANSQSLGNTRARAEQGNRPISDYIWKGRYLKRR